MGRLRTVNQDLPLYMSRDNRTGALRYKRPDNGRHVYLSGIAEPLAFQFAEVITTAFGHKPARGMRHLYQQQILSFAWNKVDRGVVALVAAKLPDVLPLQRGVARQEQVRHSWAYDIPRPESLRAGLRKIKLTECRQWVRTLYLAAKKNANQRGIPFDLSMEDVEGLVAAGGGKCVVTGIALSNDRGELPQGKRMRRPWAPSLDRIDSCVGYTTANCRVVCCAANYAMSQWGEEVLVEMAKAIARRRITRMDRVTGG